MHTAQPVSTPPRPTSPETPRTTVRGLGARSRIERARVSLRRAAPALLGYALIRVVGLAFMSGYSWHIGKHPRSILGLDWDARWYHRIAQYGYGTLIPSDTHHTILYNDLAFFPLYPITVRAVSAVVPIGSINAAILISWAATLSSVWAIYLIGEHLYGRRVGIALALLYGLLPHAIIQTMAYTEPVMIAFAAWSLYAVLTRRWLYAGILAALAGCTRPNGVAVAVGVGVGVLVDAWQRRKAGGPINWRAWAGALIAPSGWIGYLLWVGWETGDLKGYFKVQARWGSRYDFGWSALRFFKHLVTQPDFFVYYVAAGIVAATVVLFMLSIIDRIPLTLLTYSAVLLVIGLGGANFFQCKPRFLMPAFPLLIPAAIALAKARPRVAAVSVASLAGLSWFYGTYLLTVAHVAL